MSPTQEETDLLNRFYALFIDERGLTEDFQEFMEQEAPKVFFGVQDQTELN